MQFLYTSGQQASRPRGSTTGERRGRSAPSGCRSEGQATASGAVHAHVACMPSQAKTAGQCRKLHHPPLFYRQHITASGRHKRQAGTKSPRPLICTLPKSPSPLPAPLSLLSRSPPSPIHEDQAEATAVLPAGGGQLRSGGRIHRAADPAECGEEPWWVAVGCRRRG